MAKFVYSMQNILNIKCRFESLAKTEYSNSMVQLTKAENDMRILINRMREYQRKLKVTSGDMIDVTKLRQCNEAIIIIKDQIAQQAIKVKIAEKNVEAARKKLNGAMQERKIQDKLKEREFEEFKIELNELERKEIDELVSFNYNDRGTGE